MSEVIYTDEVMTEQKFLVFVFANVGERVESWKLDGKFYRADGPSVIIYYLNGRPRIKAWTLNGNLSYYEVFRCGGSVLHRCWTDEQTRLHREDGPACIEYRASGSIRKKMWALDGRPIISHHRITVKRWQRLVDARLVRGVHDV
jgi:hypothetical protein